MADTKKEHYVPQCYLQNFTNENGRVQVFDKAILQERSQLTSEIAMENYFYDIDLTELLKQTNEEKVKRDIMEMLNIDDWEQIQPVFSDKKYIEQKYLCPLETIYSQLLKRIIGNSYNGNKWVIQNCNAFSQMEKEFLSAFISLQVIRTKTFRETMGETLEKLYQTLAYKSQMNDENAIPKESIVVEANKDFVKLQHSSMLLDDEVILHFAETFCKHIWVMYINQTDMPFYTSDTPVITIPHNFDKYISYAGFNSDGVEIVFPISPNLMIAMYERKQHSYFEAFENKFIPITDKAKIEAYNGMQSVHSYRCVYSKNNNFDIVKKLCAENPRFREQKNRIIVG